MKKDPSLLLRHLPVVHFQCSASGGRSTFQILTGNAGGYQQPGHDFINFSEEYPHRWERCDVGRKCRCAAISDTPSALPQGAVRSNYERTLVFPFEIKEVTLSFF